MTAFAPRSPKIFGCLRVRTHGQTRVGECHMNKKRVARTSAPQ